MIITTSSTSIAGSETCATQTLTVVLCLVPLIGIVLSIYGACHPQIHHSEPGYVCGDAPSAIAGDFRDAVVPCLRLHVNRVNESLNHTVEIRTPTGPLCPLAGSSGMYCYERLEGYGLTWAYLWWSCDDGRERDASDEDSATTASCSAGRWRIWDNSYADSNGWYQKSASDATLEAIIGDGDGWEFHIANTDFWVDAPFLSVSSCSSSMESDISKVKNQSGNLQIPAECFDEKVHYEVSKLVSVGLIMIFSPCVLVCVVEMGLRQLLLSLGSALALLYVGRHCATMNLTLIVSVPFLVLAKLALAAIIATARAVWLNKRGSDMCKRGCASLLWSAVAVFVWVMARDLYISNAYCDRCRGVCCDSSCTLWHVKAVYVAGAILLAEALAPIIDFGVATNELNQEGVAAVDDGDQELSILQQIGHNRRHDGDEDASTAETEDESMFNSNSDLDSEEDIWASADSNDMIMVNRIT